MEKAAVLGCGSWGTALSVLLARNGVGVTLWGRRREDTKAVQALRENRRYLPGVRLPDEVDATSSRPETADFWVVAVPSDALREVCGLIPDGSVTVVVASKGLEPATAKLMSEVVREERPEAHVCALSGPNLAVEIAKGIPTATVVAARDLDVAEWVRARFMCRTFRVYTSEDVVGVELGGALKNVLAIGAGMSDGLGFGDNTKGALLARGLREIAALGEELGAERATFMGISGVGDLFATAASRLSRNYRVGRLLAEGMRLDRALDEIGQVAEGVPTSEAAVELARRSNLDIPLMEAIHRVVQGRLAPLDAVGELMERTPRVEI
ncbi:MAG: NAD(P)-dependent glycerol-3-phosphate dehydrogenase [Armatimonadetes bacterium]|nr:NAD(P)-dependent glycerol-3-phosphate dehydrogenase [Armatimonadota bacterium]